MNDTTPPRAAAASMIVEDMAWCWWTRPRAVRLGDILYLGALNALGEIVVAEVDVPTGATRRSLLARFEDDDHNNPAIVVEPGRPLVAFYSRHDADDALRYRISVRPTDISEWREERVLTFGGVTTYAEVHVRGDDLYLFTRVDETRWGYRRSRDFAETWEAAKDFLAFDTDQQVYMATALLADKRTLRVAVSGHPKEYEKKPLHDVFAAVVDLETGAVTHPGDGKVIAHLYDGTGLPLDYRDLERVHDTPSERTVNLLDVSDGPDFEVGFVSKIKDDRSTRDARYHVTTLRDGVWRTEDIVGAGAKFGYIDAGFYVGGMAFPERSPGGCVYLTREADGLWYLERFDRNAAGIFTPRLLLPASATRLTRPWAVTNPADGLEVVALALERYGEEYFGWLSHPVTAGFIAPGASRR